MKNSPRGSDWIKLNAAMHIPAPTCPICERPLPDDVAPESDLFPFCSARCRQIDLLRWCKGDYAVVDRLTPEQVAEQPEAVSPPADELES